MTIHTIHDAFCERVKAAPDRTMAERPGRGSLTFAEGLSGVGSLAAALVARGVVKGDRVAVQVDKSVEALLLCLACQRVGAIFLPLNTGYTASEIDYFVGDAEPRLFVCRPEDLERLRTAMPGTVAVESLGARADGTLLDLAASLSPVTQATPVSHDDLAAILYTSGTTGRPKGAMLSHGNLATNCEALLTAWRFTDQDRLIHALPIFHTHGLFVAANMSLAAGATMVFLEKFDADTVLDLMPDATVLMGVPTFYSRLVQSDRLTADRVSNMRLFISGSAPLLADVHLAFRAATGHAILERYGMTETCMITSNPYEGDRRAGTVGFPLQDVEVRIADREDGTVLAQGETGAIQVKGPNVFGGYWRMPEKTASEFTDDGFFITGDLGRFDAEGYLHIVGRDKDLVISGGYNVYPKEIEQLIDEVPGVVESAVIGLQHPDFGEAVTAIVVAEAGAELDEAAVIAAISAGLARYKQPKQVLFADALPRNVMGKVQKNVLRDTHAGLYKGEGELSGRSRSR